MLLFHASPCFSCHRDGLWLRLAGISRPSLWWCDVCCQWVKARTHLHFTATVMFIASIRADEKNDLFYLIYFFLRASYSSILYSLLIEGDVNQAWKLIIWGKEYAVDLISSLKMSHRFSRNIKPKELICAWRESELICAWWVAAVNCALQKALSQNGISHLYAREKWRKQPFFHSIVLVCKRVCWQHCFLIRNILSVRCDKYEPLRRGIKWIL